MEDETKPGDEPTPEKQNYDQAFFLGLAAKGKDEWNKWRRDSANKGVHVTFAGVDFSEAPRDEIDFSGFEFGDRPNFSHCKWRGVASTQDFNAFVPGRACFIRATFSYGANFVGTTFGDYASFAAAAFGWQVNFTGSTCGAWAKFTGATFDSDASFMSVAFGAGANFARATFWNLTAVAIVTFGNKANFSSATFGDFTNFYGAVFGDQARFNGAVFGALANFEDAVFSDDSSFNRVTFANDINFEGAAFGWRTSFIGTVCEGGIEFKGKCEKQSRRDLEARLHNVRDPGRAALEKRHENKWTGTGSAPDRFLTISFASARFDDEADFSRRSFEKIANFTGARFYRPPNFDEVTNASRIDFTDAQIGFVRPARFLHWTSDTKVPLRLRALRKIAEETKNHDLERDLYIEERKAERGVYLRQRWEALNKEGWKDWPHNTARLIAHMLWMAVMGIYWALADYGRSFVRPFAWLIASGFFFYWRYIDVLALLLAKAPDIEKCKQAVRMLALSNTVPFVGSLTIDAEIKKFLFCPGGNCPGPPIPPEGYQFLVLSQNLLSIVLVFFIGLALRNYFKIK